MSTQIFALHSQTKSLTELTRRSMSDRGYSEPYDLEAWLASSGESLFGRRILWISRQDRPTHDQRIDLLGVDDLGNLIVAELKRGQVGEDAITQVLSYAAEYQGLTASDLARRYFESSLRVSVHGLVRRAATLEEAQAALSTHVGDHEVNESQILLIVGEEFDTRSLAICDYLNRATGEARFSLELWTYSIHDLPAGVATDRLIFLLEQLLPPPNIREQIEEKREASKVGKYARDPNRIAFMTAVIAYMRGPANAEGEFSIWRNPGQSYACSIGYVDWNGPQAEFRIDRTEDHPWIHLPPELKYAGDAKDKGVVMGVESDGSSWVQFDDVDSNALTFDANFGRRFAEVIRNIKRQ